MSGRGARIAGLLLLAVATGLCAGASGWSPPWDAALALAHGDAIVAGLRAPRVVLAALVGASLALAGVAMQALLRNDLAEPYVLGLSGGAAVGAVASLALWPGVPPGPAAAAGAVGAASLVRVLARNHDDPARLLLGGVAVGSVLTSATGLVLVLAPGDRMLRATTFWLFGGLGAPSWPALAPPAVLVALAFARMRARAARLDALALGDDAAAVLGIDVPAQRRETLLLAVALTAVAVSAAGLVGFVGLVAPHAARRLGGATHRTLVAAAAPLGALWVVAADTVARTAFAPRELPVGLLTAAVGGPVFLWLLQRRAK